MRIAICSLRVGKEYIRITEPTQNNKRMYCQKHNYNLLEENYTLDPERTVHWSKILMLSRYLSDYDYIVWLDADLYVANLEIRIEDLIAKYTDFSLIVGSEYNISNTGVMILKNCPWTRDFLHVWYNHDNYPIIGNYEQDAFQDLYNQNILQAKRYVAISPSGEMNSYCFTYQYGNFILHFAGVSSHTDSTGKNHLESMIHQYCPDRLPYDTDQSYEFRINHLKNMKKNF